MRTPWHAAQRAAWCPQGLLGWQIPAGHHDGKTTTAITGNTRAAWFARPGGGDCPGGPTGPTGAAGLRAPPLQIIETLTRELADVRRELAMQFKRIAQLQADPITSRRRRTPQPHAHPRPGARRSTVADCASRYFVRNADSSWRIISASALETLPT